MLLCITYNSEGQKITIFSLYGFFESIELEGVFFGL
jgi:hypothetical protein